MYPAILVNDNLHRPVKVSSHTGYRLTQEEFEDAKGVIRIHISKNRQHNGQKKKYKRTNNDLKNIHIVICTTYYY
jgi:hypothetical protein